MSLVKLTKRFGKFTALDAVDLDVRDGEFLTIVGPSGSGKTTLIRLLVGMEEPTSGEIWLDGKRIERVPANRRPTCMVFQSLALFPHRSVGENIEFPLKIKGVAPAKRKERALELLRLLRLPEHYHAKRVQECSGGERQRVALARALAFDPEILFFDEPLSALDFRLRKTLEKELKDLHERTAKTFVYITHSLEEAMVMSDRIAIMREGRFEQVAEADEIYAKPASRFVASFMGEVNLIEVRATEEGLEADGVAFAPGSAERLGLTPGEAGALVVRPEKLRFLAQDGTAEAAVAGTLRASYNLGSRVQYEVDLDHGARLTAEASREARFPGQPGDRVLVGWDLDAGDAEGCHLIRGEG